MTGRSLDDALDELSSVAPEEFVLVRARLERELKATGDVDAAAALRRRRRPHLAAWACNQVARVDPDTVADLLDATAAAVSAQQQAIGGGDADSLRAAVKRRQELLDRLVERGVAILEGHTPKPAQYRDNIAATLDAATLDADAADELRAGRLTQPLLAPAGFGPLDATAVAGAPARARKPSARQREQARRDLEQARQKVRRLAAAADEAHAAVASADLAAQSAVAHLHEVDRAQERAQEAVADTSARLSEAQRDSQAARLTLRQALAGVQEAEARLAGLDTA